MVWQSLSARPHKLRSKRGCQFQYLVSALLKGTTVNFTDIAVYASTLDAAEETKYAFCDDLQDAFGRVQPGSMLIVAGGWNARPVGAAT